MGAYLSEPLTVKASSDEADDNLACGASSMQGWRVSQEDAHNCILNFDTNTSLFAVYDGHGGAEVAKYCSLKLPDFIKETEAYKNGSISKALEEAFLGFDATISKAEVIEILKELSDKSQTENATETLEDEEEEEEVSNLCEEASMPLEKIIAKYKERATKPSTGEATERLKAEAAGGAQPLSPYLRPRRAPGPARLQTEAPEPGAGGSGSSGSSSGAGSSTKQEQETDVISSTTTNESEGKNNVSNEVSTSNGEKNGDLIDDIKEDKEEIISKVPNDASVPDSSEDLCPKPSPSKKSPSKEAISSPVKEEQCNGDVTNSADSISKSDESKENVTSSSQENGDVSPSKGKGKALVKNSTADTTSKPINISATAAALYSKLLGRITDEDDEDTDSNDETFEGQEEASSDEEDGDATTNGGGEEDSSEDLEDEEDTSEDDEDAEMDNFTSMIKIEPGSDSGCTAVVALLKENMLYVANAGDSRCVVCRDGKAVDMSVDHKPEDEPELARIVKAGGKVSTDGRVNGGLNLSRAIGDLGYKQNKDLGAREQMITALPDVATLTVDPATDDFMVLACDGIWNSLTSQEVVDFVQTRLKSGVDKLSEICEQLFDQCLAPNTAGDGTGCDNMTAVIVKFKPSLTAASASKKRPSEDDAVEEAQAKRSKTDTETEAATATIV